MTSRDRFREILGSDLLSSVVVFLVALPLCMGIAIASGVDASKGLITGIIGGLLVSVLGGCPLQVSGPAAGLTVLVYGLVQKHGAGGLAVILVLAGTIQLTAGVLRLGVWFRAVPPAVVHGMLAGIGVLIFAGQFHVMVDDKPRPTGWENLLSIPSAIWKGVVPLDGSSHHIAAMLGVVSILSIVGWTYLTPKRLRVVPAPLVAVVLASALAAAFKMPVKYVSVPASLVDTLTFPAAEALKLLGRAEIIVAALAIAVIASAETLLTAAAVDQMQTGPRTRYNKELIAQGIGNTLCGLLGALPMTGVVVRSAANVNAGARTRWSGFMHGLWLLGLVVALPWLLRLIPVASLAAILVYTGVKLVNPQQIRDLMKVGRGEVATYLITMVAIVATDLLKGVLTGIGLALVLLLLRLGRFHIKIEQLSAERVRVGFRGPATFMSLPKLANALEGLPRGTTVQFDLEQLTYIDEACLELMRGFTPRHQEGGGQVELSIEELLTKHQHTAEPAVIDH